MIRNFYLEYTKSSKDSIIKGQITIVKWGIDISLRKIKN